MPKQRIHFDCFMKELASVTKWDNQVSVQKNMGMYGCSYDIRVGNRLVMEVFLEDSLMRKGIRRYIRVYNDSRNAKSNLILSPRPIKDNKGIASDILFVLYQAGAFVNREDYERVHFYFGLREDNFRR